jgi:diguanylate cyclase (GGDEF)-like protein
MISFFRRSLERKIALVVGISCLLVSFCFTTIMFYLLPSEIAENFRLSLYGFSLLFVALAVSITIIIVRIILVSPVKKLNKAVNAATKGNFLSRVDVSNIDEIGILSQNFNKMLAKLTDIEASKIDTDIELDHAQHELRFAAELEEKNRIIEDTNYMLKKRLNELALLFDVNKALTSNLKLEHVLDVLTDKLGKALQFETFYLLLAKNNQKDLKIHTILGDDKKKALINSSVDPSAGLFAKAARTKRKVLVTSLSNVVLDDNDKKFLPKTGSFLSIAIRYKDRILGLLNFIRSEIDSFPNDEVRTLISLAQQTTMAILNAQLYQEKLDQSVTDELTQLANRRLLQSSLEQECNRARRFDEPLSVLMVDIDHFKRYNDINGHLFGDKVLKRIAQILKDNTRKVDTIARFGGEEFVIVLPGQGRAGAIGVANKLRKTISQTEFPRADRQPGGSITISVGVASLPEDANSPKDLLDSSDLALYVAKDKGRNQTIVYENHMKHVDQERIQARQNKKTRRARRRRPRANH